MKTIFLGISVGIATLFTVSAQAGCVSYPKDDISIRGGRESAHMYRCPGKTPQSQSFSFNAPKGVFCTDFPGEQSITLSCYNHRVNRRQVTNVFLHCCTK